MKKAVCLISGGLDSSVSASIAKKNGYDLYCLTFFYGQKHDKEIFCAKKISSFLKAKESITLDLDFKKFTDSSLIKNSKEKIHEHDISDIGKEIPLTYVPGRNTIFLSIALSYAETIDADAIFIGATATDYSGYPDCRPEFIDAFQKLTDVATKKGVSGKKIKIEAPLLFKSKAEIITEGLKLKVPFENTWSCYKGEKLACGRCDSCLLRLKGFKEAGERDPLPYDFYPDWY